MKKKHLLLFLTFAVVNILIAQDSFLKKNKEIILSVGPTATKLLNSNIDNDEYKKVDNKLGSLVSFGYCKYINQNIGIRIGIEYSSYKQLVYQNGLFEKADQVDIDTNTYVLWINSEMTYTTNLSYLDIPIMVHVKFGNSKQFYWFIDAGIVNGFLIGSKYAKNGSIENIGRYETENPYFYIISQENPYYDYKKDTYNKEYTEMYNSYNFSLRGSFGIVATLADKIYLRIASEFTKGSKDISGKNAKNKEYANLFGRKQVYQPTTTLSFGLNVGVVFDI